MKTEERHRHLPLLIALLLAVVVGLAPVGRSAWAAGIDATGDDAPVEDAIDESAGDEESPAEPEGDETPAGDPQGTDDEPGDDPAPIDISGATVTVADQHWTGAALEPEVTVTLDDAVLVRDTDYTVAYADNIGRGTATVTVTGTGSYTGTVTATFEIGAPDFADVSGTTAHSSDILWLSEQGITQGWAGTGGIREFRPNAAVARGDMAAFLYRLAGSPDYTAPARSPFTDVNTSTAHYKEICWLASTGISKGWSNGNGTYSFRPEAPIARGDMAAFLYRMAGQPAVVAQTSGFSDVYVQTSHWREIAWLGASGVSTGWTSSNGTRSFRPNDSVVRGDMAAFLHRMSDKGLVAPGTDASAGATSGWVRRSGSWYWLEGGTAATGWRKIGGTYFLFASDGRMLTGWQKVNGTWYLLGSEGAMLTGWQTVGGKRYYLDPSSGAMVTGTRTIGGVPYRFGSDGVCQGALYQYSDMYTKAQGYSSRTGYLILIDTTQCRLAVYQGSWHNWSAVKEWSCSPGKPSTPTPKGTFRMGSRGYSFNNYGVTCYYWTQITGSYLIHSEAYKPNSFTFADPSIGTAVTHGCVRLRIANAKWVYDTVPSGTTIVVY